jgi:hypothetical protein
MIRFASAGTAGDLGMTDDPEDDWPNDSTHYPGPPLHLHAVGVLASRYNAFERILFDTYLHHLDRKKFPRALTESFYLSRDENSRMTAIKDVFAAFEKKPAVQNRIANLVEYFGWCHTVRNNILHGEVTPTQIADLANLNLTKRKGKRTAEVGYLTLDLPALRKAVDQIGEGRLQAAKIYLHLYYRDTKPAQRSFVLKNHGPEPLPKTLRIPPRQDLLPHRQLGPLPAYL